MNEVRRIFLHSSLYCLRYLRFMIKNKYKIVVILVHVLFIYIICMQINKIAVFVFNI